MIRTGAVTCIGSWPYTNVDSIIEKTVSELTELPAWPQLPKLGWGENMYVQYSEGLPCIVLDHDRERIYFDTSGDIFGPILSVYEDFLAGNYEKFAITEDFAKGLYALRRKLSGLPKKPFVKGQALGPVSLGMTLTDENKRSVLYNEQLFDAVVKACACKAAWQAIVLHEIAENAVIFIDEPYLVSFGSAYVNLTREQVVKILNEVIDKLHELGAVAGVHCCGNTDWSLLMETNADIINFDAYDYFEGMTLYPDRINSFLSINENKNLAWGIVPTSEEKIFRENVLSLLDKLIKKRDRLVTLGVNRELVTSRMIITPSCGTGSLSEKAADRVLELLTEISGLYRAYD